MKVVVVDDHPLIRKGLAAILAKAEGIELVGESDSVEDAVQLIRQTKPDLAIVDIRLEDGSGFDLVERIRSLSCRCLILTSSASGADVQRAKECGADGYVLKDAMPEELLLAIKMIEKGKKYFDQGLLETLFLKEADDPLERLTPKEREVLASLGKGLSNSAMAKELMISEFTVKKHVSSIFQKLNLSDRTQAALYAQARGLAAYSPRETQSVDQKNRTSDTKV
jgi:DNA-binding NarL/FixJ family response regulator